MPAGVTTNIQLDHLARRVHVPYFRGVFMCNALPISGARRNESGIRKLGRCERSWHSLGSICKERQSRDIFR